MPKLVYGETGFAIEQLFRYRPTKSWSIAKPRVARRELKVRASRLPHSESPRRNACYPMCLPPHGFVVRSSDLQTRCGAKPLHRANSVGPVGANRFLPRRFHGFDSLASAHVITIAHANQTLTILREKFLGSRLPWLQFTDHRDLANLTKLK